MLPEIVEHVFTLEGERYRLVEWDYGGEERIKLEYAMAIAPAPVAIEAINGPNLYAAAVARECLKEAPDQFWAPRQAPASLNGTPTRVLTLEHCPRALWDLLRKEIDAFMGKIFRELPAEPEHAAQAGATDALGVAPAHALPALPRGRAE
jgi:hypothetical protein